jgi:RNA polymerase sigma-70 factor (ECF subfamily)
VVESNDANLVKRAQEGDVDAFGELYDRHHRRIFRYVWGRVRDERLAQDLTGEVFTRMVVSLSTYRPTGIPFRAWLYRIAHNLVVDHYRKEGRHVIVPLDYAEDLSVEKNDPFLVVERRLTLERVKDALARLDPAQQEVVVLRFLAGLSLKEVALTLDRTVAAVKSLQHRGLVTLRVALEQEQAGG